MIYLGVDGGGSGCRAAVATADGAVLGRGHCAAPANIATDLDGARASVLAAAEAALEAGGRPARIEDLVAVLGLAGANIEASASRLAAALPFARARVVSDAAIAVRGALGRDDGVAAILGTGSVFAAQRRGALRFIGGWGFVLGDQGGGARLGRALLEAALLAHDGLRPATPLLSALVLEAGGPERLVAFAQTAPPAAFARLAPRLLEGDAAGEAIMQAAASEVAAALDRLLAPGPAPLCFLGGLGPAYEARLAQRYGPLIRPARASAVDGALAMARGAA